MKLDGKAIQAAMMELIDDYKLDPNQLLEISMQWIKAGFKKDYPEYKKSEILVNIQADGAVAIYKATLVVDEVEDPETQISLKDAKKIRKDVEVWEQLLEEVTPESMELSRIATMTAAQTIKQALKNIEKEKFYEKFQWKEWELLKARVTRVHGDSVVLDINWTTVVLPPEGQIPWKNYEPGEEIAVFLKWVKSEWWASNLEISQANADYIAAILEKCIPELANGTVNIEKIARMAWIKTKVIVSTNDEKVDPVGVMVGYKGERISEILSLLDGEKIDFIEIDEDKEVFLRDLLKPAQIQSVEFSDKKAIITVEEDQKPVAIWKKASNIKLASQIMWMTLEIV